MYSGRPVNASKEARIIVCIDYREGSFSRLSTYRLPLTRRNDVVGRSVKLICTLAKRQGVDHTVAAVPVVVAVEREPEDEMHRFAVHRQGQLVELHFAGVSADIFDRLDIHSVLLFSAWRKRDLIDHSFPKLTLFTYKVQG